MKQRFTRLISTILALAMLAELLPANFLGTLIPQASAAEVPSVTGFAGIPQPEELPTTVDAEIPPTIIIGEDLPAVNEDDNKTPDISPYASSVEEDTDENATSDVEDLPTPGLNAPYTFDVDNQEQINLNTGDLRYQATDYVLPGVGGLDLVIGRNYDSRYASRCSNTATSDVIEDSPLHYSILGQGWFFAFSSIISTELKSNSVTHSSQYLCLSDGTVLHFNGIDNDNNIKLEGYSPRISSFKRIKYASTKPENVTYKLTYIDGQTETFDWQGRLIRIGSSYNSNDCIQFEYDTPNGFERITITDTLQRTIVISSAEEADGSVVTTAAISDGVTLTYRTKRMTEPFSFGVLESYTDSAGQTEHYSYRLESGSYSSVQSGTDYFVNLETVTHPTGAQTVYTYEKYTGYLKTNRPRIITRDYYRITGRRDELGTQILNQKTYQYTDENATVSIFREACQYGVTVTDLSGLQEQYTFGCKYVTSDRREVDGIYKKTVTYDGTLLYEVDGDNGYTSKWSSTRYYNPLNSDQYFSKNSEKISRDKHKRPTHKTHLSSNAAGDEYYEYQDDCLSLSRIELCDDTWLLTENYVYKNKIESSDISIGTWTGKAATTYRRTKYEYDTHGNLIKETRCTNPNQSDPYKRVFVPVAEYAYQDGAYLSQVIYRDVQNADSAAASTPNQPAGTIVTSYSYDVLGRMTAMTDANGYTTQYAYDVLGNLTGVVNPDGTSTSYVRDYVNNILTYSDENNNKTRYTYTPLGLPQDVIDVQAGNVLSRREYDSMSRLIRLTDYVYGSVTEYTYDGYGNVNSETVLQGNTVLSRTTWVYNEPTADGQYLRNTKTVHGDSNTPDIVTTEYLDAYGNVAKTGRIIDGTEYFDTYTYDFQGTVLSVLRAADAAKNLPFTEKYEYNYNNQVIKHTNAAGQVITNTYDAFDRLVQTTDYAGTPTTYTYDSLGRLLTQTATVDTNQTVTTKYEYDPAGNLTHEWTPVNALGQADSWTETVYSYDSRQRLSSVGQSQWLGASPSTTTTYTYDGVGNLLSASVGSNTTAYTYDRYGNVCSMTDPSGQTETYAYTALGKPISKTDRNGQVISYTYNALGQLLSETAGTDYRLYTYAPTGQKAAEQNNWYRTAYTYDGAGRTVLVEETEQMTAGGSTSGTISYSKHYAYDPADNRTGFTLTRDGTVIQDVAYTYDSLNRLSTVSEAGIQQAEYAYDTNGNRASLTYANGVVESYTYNKANWITGISNQLGDTVISSFDYTYYASGNQKTKTDHTGKVTSYTYDGMGRLTQEAETGGVTVDYTYNAAGNRTGMCVSGTENYNTTYVYDGNNCIYYEVQHNGVTSESISYSHDGNGNIISETVSGGGCSTYTYNHFNQLSTANRAGTFTYYAYNAAGIRTGKMTGLIRTSFLLDGGNVAAELENGRVTNNYLRGANLIRWTSGMGTGYYLYNAHGDVVNLTNPAGASYRTYSYDAFGKQKNPDSFDNNPFRYCGEYYDKESGNYYLRSRYYNPANGRFTQPDSHWNSVNRIYGDNPQKINERQDALGTTLYSYRPQISAIMQSGNLYAYALNNPLRYSDSSGQIVTEAVLLFMIAHPWLTATVVSVGTVVLWNGLRYVFNKAGEWITEAINSPEAKAAANAVAASVAGGAAASGAPDPDDWHRLSNNDVKHITNRHNPNKFAQELKHLSKQDALGKLQGKSFFNQNWSQQQIIDAVNTGYQQASQAGIYSGEYSFQYMGDKITLCFRDGVLKTAYGSYTYSYEELLLLLG